MYVVLVHNTYYFNPNPTWAAVGKEYWNLYITMLWLDHIRAGKWNFQKADFESSHVGKKYTTFSSPRHGVLT